MTLPVLHYLLYPFPGLGLAGGADLPEGGRQLLQQGVQLVLAQLKLLTRHDPDHGGSSSPPGATEVSRSSHHAKCTEFFSLSSLGEALNLSNGPFFLVCLPIATIGTVPVPVLTESVLRIRIKYGNSDRDLRLPVLVTRI